MAPRLEPFYFKTATAFGVTKGILLATVATFLDVTFWKSLILVVVAAVIGFAGSLLSAWYTVREARQNRKVIKDVQNKVGADQRWSDRAES